MKKVVAVVCLGAVTCFAGTAVAGRAHEKIGPYDSVLYDNGPDDGVNAYTINSGYGVANSFDLEDGIDRGTTLFATFSNWLFPDDTAVSVDWAITNEPFGGTTFASETAALTGVDQGINGFGYDVVSQSFLLGNLVLNAGTYYLQLGNEVVSNGDPGYWGESNGPSFACQSTVA